VLFRTLRFESNLNTALGAIAYGFLDSAVVTRMLPDQEVRSYTLCHTVYDGVRAVIEKGPAAVSESPPPGSVPVVFSTLLGATNNLKQQRVLIQRGGRDAVEHDRTLRGTTEVNRST